MATYFHRDVHSVEVAAIDGADPVAVEVLDLWGEAGGCAGAGGSVSEGILPGQHPAWELFVVCAGSWGSAGYGAGMGGDAGAGGAGAVAEAALGERSVRAALGYRRRL
jgi:hypothetical protein